MTRRVLISGSIAYDTIMVFDGHFKDHILPDRVHMLNVSFLTLELKRVFGGCAANIAYNLQALGGEPVILGAVGHDGDDYLARLRGFDIDVSNVLRIDDSFTAQAFITTDLADNQITAFHPGAMGSAHLSKPDRALPAAYGIVGPNGRDAMMQHAAAFKANRVPYIFDPGQGLPMFSGAELLEMLSGAKAIAVNDYESKMLADKTGLSEQELASRVDVMLVTRGGEGSNLHQGGKMTVIAPVAIGKAVDPTGCGDAYRGGLLFGLANGMSWLDAARLGSVMGAIKIEHQGPQNHTIDKAQVASRYQQAYGAAIAL
jgi:adenosine kinase